MTALRAGRTATVRSPATSANLGPGFDCLGLALEMWDEYTATVVDGAAITVESHGEGAGEVPQDGSHLVARSLAAAFEHAAAEVPGLELVCRNRIPHGRGLGSSSAAIVGGLALARALLGAAALSDEDLILLANRIEGHPDNVAAAVLGGATIAWVEPGGAGRAVRCRVDDGLAVTVLVPQVRAETHAARGLLPETVPYADATFNVGRTALLVHALAGAPSALFAATDDRLHQGYRERAYPQSLALVADLRRMGLPAVISGAGPTVLVFGDLPPDAPLPSGAWRVERLAVAGRGAHRAD